MKFIGVAWLYLQMSCAYSRFKSLKMHRWQLLSLKTRTKGPTRRMTRWKTNPTGIEKLWRGQRSQLGRTFVYKHYREISRTIARCFTLHPELRERDQDKKVSFHKKEKKALNTTTSVEIPKLLYPNPKLNLMAHTQVSSEDREVLFHVHLQVKHDLMEFYYWSKQLEKSLFRGCPEARLPTALHPQPYPLNWIQKDVDTNISQQCTFRFYTGEFIDEVSCDVVSSDVCQIIFGSPHLWERDTVFYRKLQKYWLTKDGIVYLIHASKCLFHKPYSLLLKPRGWLILTACYLNWWLDHMKSQPTFVPSPTLNMQVSNLNLWRCRKGHLHDHLCQSSSPELERRRNMRYNLCKVLYSLYSRRMTVDVVIKWYQTWKRSNIKFE